VPLQAFGQFPSIPKTYADLAATCDALWRLTNAGSAFAGVHPNPDSACDMATPTRPQVASVQDTVVNIGKGSCRAYATVVPAAPGSKARTTQWTLVGPGGIRVQAMDLGSVTALTNPVTGRPVCAGNATAIFFFGYLPQGNGVPQSGACAEGTTAYLMISDTSGMRGLGFIEGKTIDYQDLLGVPRRATLLALADVIASVDSETVEVLAKLNESTFSHFATEAIIKLGDGTGTPVTLTDSFGEVDADTSRSSSVSACVLDNHAGWMIGIGGYTVVRRDREAPTLYQGSMTCEAVLGGATGGVHSVLR
jgi:hypothetical protein